MNKIKVIIKRPDERYGHEATMTNSLEALQRRVEGHIETVTLGDVVIICNEEGKWIPLIQNFKMIRNHMMDIVRGTVIVCGHKDEEFSDCPIDMREWRRMLESWGNR